MMQCGKDPAGTFKTMAEVSNIFKPIPNSEDTDNSSTTNIGEKEIKRCLSFSSEKDFSSSEEPNMTRKDSTLQSVPDSSSSCRLSAEIAEQLSPPAVHTRLKAKNAIELCDVSSEYPLNSKQQSANDTEDKENNAAPFTTTTQGR